MIRGIKQFLPFLVTTGISLVIGGTLFAEESRPAVETRSLRADERAEFKPYEGNADLSDVIKNHTKSFMIKMTDLQKTNGALNQIFTSSKPEDFEKTSNRMNFIYESDAQKVDRSNEINQNLSNQTTRTASERFKESSPLYQKIKAGLSFDLSLSSKKSSSKTAIADNQPKKFSYGLIVEDIVPEKASDRASLDSIDNEMIYAKKARVKYTIGKLDEESPSIIPVPLDYDQQMQNEPGFFDNVRLPRPDFAVKMEPGSDPTGQSSPSLLSSGLVLEQKDGLYRYRKIVGQNNLTPEQAAKYPTHEFRVPTYRTVAFGRIYNSERQLIQTSVYGILVSEKMPQVNLHYMELEEKYKAEMVLVRKVTTIKGNIEMRQGWKPGQSAGEEGDRITLEIARPL